MNYKIVKFIKDNIDIDVYVDIENKTVWLTLTQMMILYGKSRTTVARRIKNLYESGEIKMDTTCAKIEHMVGNQTYQTAIYNLDVIIEIGRLFKITEITSYFFDWSIRTINSLISDTAPKESNIIRFDNGLVSLDVRITPEEDTVWLTQDQMAILFGTTAANISMHITNIYGCGELEKRATHKDFLIVQIEGNREIQRKREHYNLDVIISVGYRVNTIRGIQFRRWASSVLKQYLLKGSAINDKRVMVTQDNYLDSLNAVLSMQNRIDKLEKWMKELVISDVLIYENKAFDALVIINKLVEKAINSIVLIDPYVDILTLDAFKNVKPEISLFFITSKKCSLSKTASESFKVEHPSTNIIECDDYHDRYLIIDNEIYYHLGTSINYLGKRLSQITRIEDADIIEALKNRIFQIKCL